jgi:hypothetical protein
MWMVINSVAKQAEQECTSNITCVRNYSTELVNKIGILAVNRMYG